MLHSTQNLALRDLQVLWSGWLLAAGDDRLLFAQAMVESRAHGGLEDGPEWDAFASGLPGYNEISRAHMIRLLLHVVKGSGG